MLDLYLIAYLTNTILALLVAVWDLPCRSSSSKFSFRSHTGISSSLKRNCYCTTSRTSRISMKSPLRPPVHLFPTLPPPFKPPNGYTELSVDCNVNSGSTADGEWYFSPNRAHLASCTYASMFSLYRSQVMTAHGRVCSLHPPTDTRLKSAELVQWPLPGSYIAQQLSGYRGLQKLSPTRPSCFETVEPM